MIIDTHCHYNIPPLWDDADIAAWKQHWHTALEAGISGAIVVGVNEATSIEAVDIVRSDNRLIAAVGFHPTDDLPEDLNTLSAEFTTQTLENIEKTIRSLCTSNSIAAIGEVGLDYFRPPTDEKVRNTYMDHQKSVCALQLRLATEFKLPLILHVRDQMGHTAAYTDMLALLRSHASHTQPFILHCVSGPLEYIKQAVSLGAYIGVAGNVTYPSAHAIREIVSSVPTDRILLETDAPFLAPQTHRGKPCLPWMITETAHFIQNKLAIDLEQVHSNTLAIFSQFSTK